MEKVEMKIRVTKELKAKIDQARGFESLNGWVVRTCEEKILRVFPYRPADADPAAEPVVIVEVKK